MKLASAKQEQKAIHSICNGKPEVRERLLYELTEDSFGFEPTKKLFQRLLIHAKKGSNNIPRVEDFKEDITLDEDCRKILKKSEIIVVKKRSMDTLIANLEKYRKTRIVYDVLKESLEGITKSTVQIEDVLNNLSNSCLEARTKKKVHVSNQNNNKGLIDDLLNNGMSFVPTGYKAWDNINGGLPCGQVIVLAANSGGGKSAMALNMALRQYKLGYTPTIYTFEMTDQEYWARGLSNITKLPITKFMLKKLNDRQKKLVWKKQRLFEKHGKKMKNNFNIVSPDEALSMSEIIYQVKHIESHVLYIDYVSLLAPEDKTLPTHEQLGLATKRAKIGAKELGIPIVILAQLNEDDQLKYSRAMNEDAGLVFIWRLEEEEKAAGELPIRCTKARMQKAMDFMVVPNLECLRFEDLSYDNLGSDDEKKDESSSGEVKYKNPAKMNLSNGEDL